MPEADKPSVVIELGEFSSPEGLGPYQIRPPVGYRESKLRDKDNPTGTIFRWSGELYDLTSTLSSMPYIDVATWEDPTGTTTVEREIERKLKKISGSKSSWMQGNITNENLNGTPFLYCAYDFSDPGYGSGRGFLFATVDGGTVVLMASAAYEVGGYDHLEIANASARTFQKSEEPAEKEPGSQRAGTIRTWKDATGKFSVEAEFSGVVQGNVRLRKADGSEVAVPLERLSQEDQEWVKNHGHPEKGSN